MDREMVGTQWSVLVLPGIISLLCLNHGHKRANDKETHRKRERETPEREPALCIVKLHGRLQRSHFGDRKECGLTTVSVRADAPRRDQKELRRCCESCIPVSKERLIDAEVFAFSPFTRDAEADSR
jgi:hypothetical protein